ncbi:MAG: L-threonylcarbamoyladenylate synthase [Flavobacteriales bacterium]|jgi:L-threonylcarbamoyladenylate synthase
MTLDQSIEVLKEGGILLYPTDTIWGLGCDATNETACKRIIEIKNRPLEKSFVLLVDGFPMLERYVPDFHPICYDLADLSHKPLTIIYPNVRGIAASIPAADGSVGIRITKDPICLKLLRSIRKPLVSTSANLSGTPSPTCYSDINPQIVDEVDAVVEERLSEKMITPSQIIKIDLDGSVKIIRK